jgi:hypothetical protein
MALEVIAHSSGCEDGTCPTFFQDPNTGDVVVRGYDLADPAIEHDVRIPAADWAFLVAQLPR